jgi:hypothetical protein
MEVMQKPDELTHIKECIKKTHISYRHHDGFFTPRLRRINHLEVGYSKIISNPITILLERLYVYIKRIRRWMHDWNHRSFPRRPKIHVGRIDSYLTGRVVHQGRHDVKDPVHNIRIEFWARTRLTLQYRKLGEAYTGMDGNFNIPFTLRKARRFWNRSVRIDIMLPHEIKYADGVPSVKDRIYHTIFINKNNLLGLGYNLQTIALPIWEYRRDTKMPRTYFPEDTTYSPEVYNQKRIDALIQQIIPIELTKQKHMLQIADEPGVLTIHKIQSDYPDNLTVCIEKSKSCQGYTRTDEWFVERLINGMNKATLQPDSNDPDLYHVRFFGICTYDHNEEYALPDADILLKKNGDEIPRMHEIHFTGPLNAFDRDPWQTHSFTPADGELWLAAKRLARVCGAVTAEVDEHFAGTHVNTEQYAIAAYRNFRKSPISFLLFPHVKEVALINATADKTIVGGYLPVATALTEQGLEQRIYDALGSQNWKGWKPMTPVCKRHNYAHAENLFWKLTGDFIDWFFITYKDEIIREWCEVYNFSQNLVNHSAAVFGSSYDFSHEPREEKRLEERIKYANLVYSYDRRNSTEYINGDLKVISPITKESTFKFEEDFVNLKEACRYIIMMATFSHTWINEHQCDDLGEILYNCGGLRFGEKKIGVMAPELDLSIAPDLTRATQMLWFTNLLSRTEYGFITQNEEHDIHPYFIELLLKHKAEFEKYGVDVEAIESRTNI